MSEHSTILICHEYTEPSFNLACEEFFLTEKPENYTLLWRNSPSIIIGRNQNAYAEIDMDYVRENNIKIIRRLTGGGAVFHDLGNLNFTFIKNGVEGFADFGEFLKPVTSYLRSLGLNAEFSGRNDILVDGMKVSGNAQVSKKGRVMLHGTLLFSASLPTLGKALKPNPLKLESKGIKSVKSRVTNIENHLKQSMTVESFTMGLKKYVSDETCIEKNLSRADINGINALVKTKYGTDEWNIGSAPDYSVTGSIRLNAGILTAVFDVDYGKISKVKMYGDFFGSADISELENALLETFHNKNDIKKRLSEFDIDSYISGSNADEIAEVFFKYE